MDGATIIGIFIAFGAILAGQVLEGGHISSILQPTAALIVFGGTLGAISIQFPSKVLRQTLRALRQVWKPTIHDTNGVVETIVRLATKARREGLVAIENEADLIKDPFLKRALEMAIDGTEAKALRAALEIEITHFEEDGEAPIKVLEAGGGYSPTVGIIGAVLGLIHVMENLSDPSKLGGGIAVAFVATVYGVSVANLLFLPMAGKLKARHRERTVVMELILEGVCAISEGENPHMIERKLAVYRDKTKTRPVAAARAKLKEAA